MQAPGAERTKDAETTFRTSSSSSSFHKFFKEISMTATKVQPIPQGMHTVTPHLVCAGAADAIEFYKKAFGAVEVSRVPGPNGKIMHAQIRIGDCAVFLVDAFPEWGSVGPESLKSSPVTVHLYVPDADAV